MRSIFVRRAHTAILAQLAAAGGGAGGAITLSGGAFGPSNNNTLQRIPLGFTSFFIDPSNSSGLAADSNNGLTSATPILTTNHLNALLLLRRLTANTTITYMSDDPGAIGVDWSTMDLAGFTLTFQGTPVVVHTGGTLNAGTTAINPAAGGGGQRQTAHTTDILNFGPFVSTDLGGTAAHPCLLVDDVTTDTTWIVSGTGSATASCSRPVTTGMTAGAIASSHAYQIRRGSTLFTATAPMPVASGGGVVLNDFALASIGIDGATYNRCSFVLLTSGGTFNHCFVHAIVENTALAFISLNAGVLVSTSSDELSVPLTLSGDTYVTGAGLLLGNTFYSAVFVTPGIGAGVQVQDAANGVLAVTSDAFVFSAASPTAPLIWGNGNAQFGMLIQPGATVTVPAEVGVIPTVTGVSGDFAFQGAQGSPATVARAWNEVVGAYTEAGGVATRTTTWAHFAAAIGAGGFGFQAHNPATDASIVGL